MPPPLMKAIIVSHGLLRALTGRHASPHSDWTVDAIGASP